METGEFAHFQTKIEKYALDLTFNSTFIYHPDSGTTTVLSPYILWFTVTNQSFEVGRKFTPWNITNLQCLVEFTFLI